MINEITLSYSSEDEMKDTYDKLMKIKKGFEIFTYIIPKNDKYVIVLDPHPELVDDFFDLLVESGIDLDNVHCPYSKEEMVPYIIPDMIQPVVINKDVSQSTIFSTNQDYKRYNMLNEKTKLSKLILGVEKPIWLATTMPLDKGGEILGWTMTKPVHDNGFIDKGSVLIFIELSEEDIERRQSLEFMIMYIGPVPGEYPADFYEEEIDSLTKEGALTLLSIENVDEISIIAGDTFIKYPRRSSFDTKVFSPRDLYIIMSPEQMKQSNSKIVTGEKISLDHILEVYSRAIGQNLILK